MKEKRRPFYESCLNSHLLLLLLLPLAAQANTQQVLPNIQWEKTNLHTVETYILPKYKQLAKEAAELKTALQNECTHPTILITQEKEKQKSYTLTLSKKHFRQLYLQWATVQHIHFGPMVYLKRKERFQYWPDKHKVGGKQLRRLLTSEPLPKTLRELQQKSVAIQGLPALEKIIYSQPTSLSDKHCLLAIMIADNLYDIASANIQAWTQPPALFINDFKKENYSSGAFISGQAVANTFFNSIIQQLQTIQQLKLGYAFPVVKGSNQNKKVRPRALEAWKSQLSLDIIKANISSLYALYRTAFQHQLSIQNPKADQDIQQQWTHVIAMINTIDTSLYQLARAPKEQQNKLKDLSHHIQGLSTRISVSFKKDLRLRSAFNSLDGD